MNVCPVYISLNYSWLEKQSALPDCGELGINLVLDKYDFEIIAVIDVIKRFRCNWILSISEKFFKDQLSDQSNYSKLYLLYTLSGFYQQAKKIIPVFTDRKDVLQPFINSLKIFFESQGVFNSEFLIVSPIESFQTVNKCAFGELSGFETFETSYYKNLIKQRIEIAVIGYGDENSFKMIMDSGRYIKEQSSTSMNFIQAMNSNLQAELARHQNLLWKRRTELYYSFIPLSKRVSEKQYGDLIDWYNKEYEILPKWYKQIGHIIKVLMGKRTFKSLFNNDVKKYKD